MWSAAILAGGQARRFGGCDKGALVVDGRTIRARQLAALSQVADDIMIVGMSAPHRLQPGDQGPYGIDASDAEADAIGLDTAAGLLVRTVSDRLPGRGPLGGLHAALWEARGDAVAIVACDMPFVSAPFLAHLLTLTSEADAVVPLTERGYHPLCAAYTRACLEPIVRRLGEGQLKMTTMLDDVRVRKVTAAEMCVFGDPDKLVANVNTPDEFRGLAAHQGHEG
jgi:molybdopterin-guanine dinucleotide biosynthesis protein A